MPRRDHSAPNREGERVPFRPSRLPIASIDSSPLNPRKRFGDDELGELARSMEADGLLQPIVVTPVGERFAIVAGERRWRAAKQLGWSDIPAIVRPDIDEATHVRLALLENLARTDLDPLEEAAGYQQLQDLGMTQQAIADAVHRSQPSIANAIRLLKAPEQVRERLATREISPSHVLALLRYEAFPEAMVKMAEVAAERHTPTKVLEKGLGELGYEFQNALTSAKLAVAIYTAEFDRKVCEKCPFGAYAAESSYGGYCLKPEHFRQLQKEARAAKKADAQKALEAVPTPNGTPALRVNQLRNYTELYDVPRGCTPKCECRRTALSYGDRPIQVCVNPPQYRKLQQAQREREEQQRKERVAALRTRCSEVLDPVSEVRARELVLLLGAVARGTRFDDLVKKALKAYAPDAKLVRLQYDELSKLEPVQIVKIAVAVLLSDELAQLEQWSRGEEGYASWYVGERTPKPKRKGKAEAAADEQREEVLDHEPERELAEVSS